MSNTPARPLAALVVMAAALVGGAIAAAPDADAISISRAFSSSEKAHPARPHTACLTEDSTWCVRDAKHAGNGRGRSYWVDRSSVPHFVSHARAHHMIRAGR